MTDVALFHSVLGVREGVHDARRRLEGAGHRVLVVDQYDGAVFDDYDAALAHAEGIGYPELMRRALDAVADLPDGFSCLGFSNGGGMATFVAAQRPVARVVLCSGALDPAMIGLPGWPAGVDAQIHYTVGDPFRTEGQTETVAEAVRDAGCSVEVFDYPGRGHLFTDPSRAGEYDAEAAELLWSRALAFLAASPSVATDGGNAVGQGGAIG